MRPSQFFAAAIALCLFAAPASAQDLKQWGTAGGWDVMVDPSLGDGCLIQAEYENGALVRIGLDRDEGHGYVAAFHYDWGAIEDGARYDVRFDLDGEIYDGEAIGIYIGDLPGADIHFDNVEFLIDIAAKQTMTLYNDNGEVMAIDLTGTAVGIEAVMECQQEMG